MGRSWAILIGAGISFFGSFQAVPGEVNPASIAQAKNLAVGLVAGQAGSTDATIAAELAQVASDDLKLRIVPIQGNGSAQNIADLIFRKGIDVAIIHSDALSDTMRSKNIPRETSLRYIANLFQEEVHVLARNDIKSISELNSKPVAVGVLGGDSDQTAIELFKALALSPRLVHITDAVALDRLKIGEIAAIVIVGGQPVPILQALGPSAGLHFLTIPLNALLLDTYLPTKLDHRAYPNLVPPDMAVSTVSVPAILVTVSAPSNSARGQRVDRFVDALFAHLAQLREAGHHPKWHEVNLLSQVYGMNRYPKAQALARTLSGPPPAAWRDAFLPNGVSEEKSERRIP